MMGLKYILVTMLYNTYVYIYHQNQSSHNNDLYSYKWNGLNADDYAMT